MVIEPGDEPPTAEPVTPTPTSGVGTSVVNSVSVGVVFVTEIMANPSAVGDTAGEWFEVYNSSSDVSVDLNGWTIRDQGNDAHLISHDSPKQRSCRKRRSAISLSVLRLYLEQHRG